MKRLQTLNKCCRRTNKFDSKNVFLFCQWVTCRFSNFIRNFKISQSLTPIINHPLDRISIEELNISNSFMGATRFRSINEASQAPAIWIYNFPKNTIKFSNWIENNLAKVSPLFGNDRPVSNNVNVISKLNNELEVVDDDDDCRCCLNNEKLLRPPQS